MPLTTDNTETKAQQIFEIEPIQPTDKAIILALLDHSDIKLRKRLQRGIVMRWYRLNSNVLTQVLKADAVLSKLLSLFLEKCKPE